MKQNDTSALKLAIVEGMSAMLAAIDNTKTVAPESNTNQYKQNNVEKAEPTQRPAKKKHNRKKHKCYRVEDLRALYRLADAGLLHCIRGTAASTNFPGSYVYLIERNTDTKAALAVFLTQEEIAEDV